LCLTSVGFVIVVLHGGGVRCGAESAPRQRLSNELAIRAPLEVRHALLLLLLLVVLMQIYLCFALCLMRRAGAE
jgi:hypothetical protein